MDGEPTFSEELRVLRRASPGAVVFVTVLFLLRGYGGTVHALPRQIILLVESFFGGPDVMELLLLHTLPHSPSPRDGSDLRVLWSFIVLGGIVMAGTAVGGVLRSLLPTPTVKNPNC